MLCFVLLCSILLFVKKLDSTLSIFHRYDVVHYLLDKVLFMLSYAIQGSYSMFELCSDPNSNELRFY